LCIPAGVSFPRLQCIPTQGGLDIPQQYAGQNGGGLAAAGIATSVEEVLGEVACPACDVFVGVGLVGWAAYIAYKNGFRGAPNSNC
jgi:hypothetical protein